MTVIRWCVQDEVNQEESELYEVDRMKEEADLIALWCLRLGWLSSERQQDSLSYDATQLELESSELRWVAMNAT